ncbi:Dr1-associated corepressor [Nematocida sp. AWRm80]|nr:Dr1-associated corepressor [Nematocida sp. AWRm80]
MSTTHYNTHPIEDESIREEIETIPTEENNHSEFIENNTDTTTNTPTEPVNNTDTSHMDLKKKCKCRFPVARIKKIMQINEEIGKISVSAPIVISHAIELFLIDLLKQLETQAKNKSSKKIVLSHLELCINENPKLDFLKGILPKK